MRALTLMLVGLFLTFACLLLYVFEPPFVRDISLKTYDFLLNQVHSPAASGRVAIVDLDEESIAHYGQWPWSRYRMAELTEKIFNAGASVVAFDIVFSEPDRTSPRRLLNDLNSEFKLDLNINGLPDELEDFDMTFAKSLSGRNVILGCFLNPSRGVVADVDLTIDQCYRGYFYTKGPVSDNKHLVHSDGLQIAIPVLSEAAGNNAFINTLPDADNVVRATPLIWAYGASRIYPSLALEAVRMDADVRQIGIEYDENGIAFIRLLNKVIPTDAAGRLQINFREIAKYNGHIRSLPWYSAKKVLADELAPDCFAGKIVLVGTSATGLRDLRATPLAPEFAGVEIHAVVIDNILSGDMLIHPRWIRIVDMLAILAIGVLLCLFITKGRSWLSFLCTIMLILFAVWCSLFLLRKWNIMFIPTWPIISILFIYMTLTMVRYWQEERQKRQVRQMFGTMVSQEVLVYLEKHPESLSLSGQKAEATMFFSDVAGFTTISEKLAPDKLSELLNHYLSPMTTIIMNRKGYVDKYEGDAIMAEWGVPFPLDDHAVQACLAALEQQDVLNVLRPILERQFGYLLYVRMGINSGLVTAGNMGSERRQQFTVMGDAVNQAARLEPVNKEYGTAIIIGESTRKAVGDVVETRLLDKIVVVGKTVPSLIYELLGRKNSVPDARLEAASFYEQGLRMHWQKQWDEAEVMLEKSLRISSDDKAVIRLKKRIEFYRKNPPDSKWMGEYTRLSKD